MSRSSVIPPPDAKKSRAGSSGQTSNEEIQTHFIPAGDGPMQGMPQSWNGALSGTRFSSHWQDGYPVMTVHLDAEIPIQVNHQMRDEACLLAQSRAFDLALKVACDDEIPDTSVARNAIGITWVRDYFTRSYTYLSGILDENHRSMAPALNGAGYIRSYRRSLKTLERLADRLDARLNAAVPQPVSSAIRSGDPSVFMH